MINPKILAPHQVTALEKLATKNSSPIFMSMRLGKNLVIIRHLQSKGLNLHNFKILFVTTIGAMDSIHNELMSEGEQVTILRGTKPQRLKTLASYSKGWLVVNYESCSIYNIHKMDWKVIILDESIKIANPKSNLTKYFLSSAWNHVKYRYLLNGAPNPESDMQLVSQFLFTNKVFMDCYNFWQYRNRYYIKNGEWDYIPKTGHKKDLIDYVHTHAIVMYRGDIGIGSLKEYSKRILSANAEQIKATKELIENYEVNGVQYKNELGVQVGLAYIAGGLLPSEDGKHVLISDVKIKELLHIISSNYGEKILVWTRFVSEQYHISKALVKHDIEHIVINGSIEPTDRIEIKKEFDKSKTCNVALLTIASCAKGQDWSLANTSVFYSNEWSNDLRIQAEERMIHVHKKEPIVIIDLLTNGCIDGEVLFALKEKTFNVKQVMSNFVAKLSK